MNEIELYDNTNREGLAAKAYFAGLFSKDFIRGENTPINAALDYGYQILLSCFNREIKSCGYLTEVGFYHQNQHNHFNLSSDLMEPFRPIVDEVVYNNSFSTFGKDEKRVMQTILHKTVRIQNRMQLVPKAISIYTKSILDSLVIGELENIKWLQYGL